MAVKILVVDDEVNLRKSLAYILTQNGYAVDTAENASIALDYLKAAPFDILILDLKMPDVDGLTLLKMIRDEFPALIVLILTAYSSMDTAMDAIKLNVRDYFMKPLDPTILLRRIESLLVEEKETHTKSSLDADTLPYRATQNSPLDSEKPLDSQRYIQKGAFLLDLKTQRVEINGNVIPLPPSTFSYLVILTQHSPDPVSYEDLVFESQKHQPSNREARSIARWQIHELRQAIEKNSQRPQYILTVRNIGYCLITEG